MVNLSGVAVIVGQLNGAVTFGDLPLFAATQVEMQTFEPEACPLCARNVPLENHLASRRGGHGTARGRVVEGAAREHLA